MRNDPFSLRRPGVSVAAGRTGNESAWTLYGERNPRDLPYYTVPEAARHLKMPASTLRTWVAGYTYPTVEGRAHSGPVIVPPESSEGLRLSFTNLIEAGVLLSLRTVHDVSMGAVRMAVEYAESELGVSHLLIRRELRTDGGSLFLRRYGELIDLSRSGQFAIQEVLSRFLKRVVYDDELLPERFFPFIQSGGGDEPEIVAIDPRVAFGRPVVWPQCVSTSTLVERIDAGEEPSVVAEDYGLTEEEVSVAVVYERAA